MFSKKKNKQIKIDLLSLCWLALFCPHVIFCPDWTGGLLLVRPCLDLLQYKQQQLIFFEFFRKKSCWVLAQLVSTLDNALVKYARNLMYHYIYIYNMYIIWNKNERIKNALNLTCIHDSRSFLWEQSFLFYEHQRDNCTKVTIILHAIPSFFFLML